MSNKTCATCASLVVPINHTKPLTIRCSWDLRRVEPTGTCAKWEKRFEYIPPKEEPKKRKKK